MTRDFDIPHSEVGTMSWNIRKRTPDSFQNPVGYYQRCGETYINDVVNLNTSGRATRFPSIS